MIFGLFLQNTREEWPEIWHVDVFWSPSELIRFWSWSIDFPPFGTIFTSWNRSNLGFLGIFFGTHGRNGLICDMLMYPDHFWNWLHFDDRLLIFLILVAFWLSERGEFAVSRHLDKNAWEEWAEICHADVSWPPSELIWFWSRWGATAIRPPDLLVHLYLVISGIPDCCVVRLFQLSLFRNANSDA